MALSVHLVKPVYKPARDYSLKAVREEVGRTLDICTVGATDAGERGEEGEDHAEGGGQNEHVPAAFAPGSEVSAEPEPGAAVAVSIEENAESEIIEALTRHRLADVIPTFVGAEVDATTVRELTKDEFGSWVSEVEFTTIQKKRLWKMFAEMHAHDTIDSMSELEIVAMKDSVIAEKDSELAALRAALIATKSMDSGDLMPATTESAVTVKLDAERRADSGCPIFIEAIQNNDFEKFKLHWTNRRELPANATFKSKNAMHWAAKCGRVDVLKFLVADGALGVNDETEIPRTALMCAAVTGQTEAVRFLLALENVDADMERGGRTALVLAVNGGHLPCIKLLVEVGGASPTLILKEGPFAGASALDRARSFDRADIRAYLGCERKRVCCCCVWSK